MTELERHLAIQRLGALAATDRRAPERLAFVRVAEGRPPEHLRDVTIALPRTGAHPRRVGLRGRPLARLERRRADRAVAPRGRALPAAGGARGGRGVPRARRPAHRHPRRGAVTHRVVHVHLRRPTGFDMSEAVVGARQDRRAETSARIKAVARSQIARDGAAAFSLGSIAREMGISTPALYRYFANRDALVTALVLDSYRDLGDETENAVVDLDDADLPGRFHAMAHAYRAWALDHPQDYVLIHGAVLPGYRAPLAEIATAAIKLLRLFTQLLADAEEAGVLRLPASFEGAPTGVGRALQPLTGGEVDPRLATLAYLIWSQLHALVWQEIDGHLPRELLADGVLFGRLVDSIAAQLGLD